MRAIGQQIVGYKTAEEALKRAEDQADTVDAVIIFDTPGVVGQERGYTLRVNHTAVPSTKTLLNRLDLLPDTKYRNYWLFANIQHHLDRFHLVLLCISQSSSRNC